MCSAGLDHCTDLILPPGHRRMRRGQGGCSPPPSFWATQFFGQRRSFFGAAAMVGGGCFSIFRRADDVTRTMSKGGGVLVKSPPSGNPVSAPVICVKFWPINPSAPLTKAFPYAYATGCGVRPLYGPDPAPRVWGETTART